MTAKEIYESYQGTECTYEYSAGKIAGYCNDLLIIGFNNGIGCIEKFNKDNVVVNDCYQTYRFAKPYKVTIRITDANSRV